MNVELTDIQLKIVLTQLLTEKTPDDVCELLSDAAYQVAFVSGGIAKELLNDFAAQLNLVKERQANLAIDLILEPTTVHDRFINIEEEDIETSVALTIPNARFRR
jgi:Mg/Co/Ni transporter MgtE